MDEQFNISDPLDCQHGRTERRRRINAAGNPFHQLQCMECGQGLGSALSMKGIDPDTVQDWAIDLQEQGQRAINEHRKTLLQQRQADLETKNAAWWDWYNAYLRTPEWAERRRLALERDERWCKACGKAQAVQVHHKDYRYVGNEPLWDLESVCIPCHEQLTAMDRGLIETRGGPPTRI